MRRVYGVILWVIILLTSIDCISQNVWNSNSFKFTIDIATLDLMTGSTAITFPGAGVGGTDTISFPGGFKFHYGLDNFRHFSVSKYGWVKFGGKVRYSFSQLEDTVIAPFTNSFTPFTCSYKMTGTAPARKFIIEWSGTFDIQAVKCQLWLYERTGTIEIVNQGLNAYFSGAAYNIFCKTKILSQNAFVSIDVKPIPQAPSVDYVSVIGNMEGIPSNTRYRFEPDTIKPVSPALLFSSVLPGCFSVDVKDQSINELFFNLEKNISGNTYVLSKRTLSTTTPSTGALYTHNETGAKPDSFYTFRAYASNGFINSDTIVQSLLTPMPMISGIKTIPGDYPTINALLADATCKHIGPNLIIELQPNYSYATEGGAVRFKPALMNKLLASITVRPAASATSLVLSNTAAFPLFAVDSVTNIHFDGRAGGIGTTNNLTLNQGDINQPAIAYFNNANNGGIHFTNIQGQNSGFGLIYISHTDPLQYPIRRNYPVSNMTINNCKIGPSSGFTYKALLIDSGANNTVRDNEFFRFILNAVNFTKGGENSRVVRNRLYQPDPVPMSSSLGAMEFTEMGNNFSADSNRIGGSAAAWGAGSWRQGISAYPEGFSLIKITGSTQPGTIVYARNNEIGNINTTGTNMAAINVQGNSVISNNRIGTADSVGSVVSQSFQTPISVSKGSKAIIKNNFISGIKADNEMIMVWHTYLDTTIITNNDLGGSDNYYANSCLGQITGIGSLRVKEIIIKNNQIRGLSSQTHSAIGIEDGWSAATDIVPYVTIDSNSIHHLDGRRSILGMFIRSTSRKNNSFSYNKIYALNGRGPNTFSGADNPTLMTAIAAAIVPSDPGFPNIDTGSVTITGNLIYGLDYTSPSDVYPYSMTGISCGGNPKISNNMISLGLNMAGNVADSVELTCIGINAQPIKNAFVEHNSVYFGGSGKWGSLGINFPTNTSPSERKNIYLTNNIIEIDRRSTTPNDNKEYFASLGTVNNNVVSNKNIWYSTIDPDINAKLELWRSNCQCDSLSFIADPKFINPAGDSLNNNLHLQAVNPADSAGTPSVIDTFDDIDGQIRNNYSPVDIGADAVTPCPGSANAAISITPYQETIEVCTGLSLTLTATLSGNVSQLQWQKNLNNIPGATGISYNVTTPGSYRLTGRSSCGKISSKSMLVLTAVSDPSISLHGVNPAPYCDSTTIEMKVDHNHYTLTTLQYKWYKNSVLLPGKITDHEFIDAIRLSDVVRVDVTNNTACGITTVRDSVQFFNISTSYHPQINVLSFTDSLYSLTNVDTVKFSLANASGGIPEVIYITPVPAPLHRLVGDSLFIFTNLPSTIKFKLHISMPGNPCFFADTTEEKTIYVSDSQVHRVYTFTGNGNWNNPSNWQNNEMPSSPLPFNATVIVNPASGSCILNVPFTVGPGAHLTVRSGAVFIIQGNLLQQ